MASEFHDPQSWPAHIRTIELALLALDEALRSRDPSVVEPCAQALHKSLADALAAFRQARQQGLEPLSAELRQKLMLAQTRVAGLRTAVHRAASSVERTLGVLFTPEGQAPADTYAPPVTRPGPGAALLNAYRGA